MLDVAAKTSFDFATSIFHELRVKPKPEMNETMAYESWQRKHTVMLLTCFICSRTESARIFQTHRYVACLTESSFITALTNSRVARARCMPHDTTASAHLKKLKRRGFPGKTRPLQSYSTINKRDTVIRVVHASSLAPFRCPAQYSVSHTSSNGQFRIPYPTVEFTYVGDLRKKLGSSA